MLTLSWHSPFLSLFSGFNYPPACRLPASRQGRQGRQGRQVMWGERREQYEAMVFGDCPVGLSLSLSLCGEGSSSRHEGSLNRESKCF
jgi:hypothetical protein